MRLMIRPITMSSPKTLSGDSNYLLLRDFCDRVLELKDGKAFFNFLMPIKYRGVTEDTDHVKHYFFPMLYYDWHFTQAYVPPELGTMLNRRFGKGPVCDALICETSAGNCGADNIMSTLRRRIPIFVRDTAVAYPGYIHDTVEWQMYRDRGIGYSYSALNFFNSELEKKMAMRLMTKYLKPNIVKETEERSFAVHRGIDIKKIKPAKLEDKNKKFTIMFGGRFNSVKNFDKLFEILNKATILYGIDGVATTQLHFPRELTEKYPLVKFYEEVNSKRYKDMLKKAHIFLNTSLHESYSVGTIEAIACNTICFLPERKWVTEGMYKDAPYIYSLSKVDNALRMIKAVKSDYEGAFKKFDTFRKSFIKAHERTENVQFMLERMEEAVADNLYFHVTEDKLRAVVEGFVKEGQEEVYLEQIHRRFFGEALSVVDSVGCPNNMLIYPGRYDFYRSMLEYNLGEDLFDGADIRFRLNA